MKTVLFLCTHNSARSQMAEAFLNALCGDKFKAESAGISATKINPYVAKVMTEIGIPLTGHRSKSVTEFQGKTFSYVVTVCDLTREECPFFPGEVEMNKSFPDPSSFTGTDEEILTKVRRVRDEIKEWINNVFCKGNPNDEAGLQNMRDLLKGTGQFIFVLVVFPLVLAYATLVLVMTRKGYRAQVGTFA
jgi:arsenate reductase